VDRLSEQTTWHGTPWVVVVVVVCTSYIRRSPLVQRVGLAGRERGNLPMKRHFELVPFQNL